MSLRWVTSRIIPSDLTSRSSSKPGLQFGTTDEYGYNAQEVLVHFHDIYATILQLMGIDHEQITYRYAGREFRLTYVHGRIVNEILA